MNWLEIFIYSFCGVLAVALFIQSIFLLKGKGANLIAGYNTLPKAEKEKYNTKALCNFVGVVLYFLNVFINGMIIAIVLKETWIAMGFGAAFMGMVILCVNYINSSSRFKKKEIQPESDFL